MRPKHFLACLALTFAGPLFAAENDPPMGIELVPHGTQWEVRYTLPEGTQELRFERVDAKGTRASSWIAVDPAFKMTQVEGEEVVRRTDGAAFDRVAFRMAPLYIELEKDYAPFSPFGDGGLLIYTGRFHACAGYCTPYERYQISLKPPPGTHVIVDGKVASAAHFLDTSEGTNLYVGSALPVDTPNVVAVVDPTLPAGVRTRLESLLPRLMGFYGKQFGVLPTRPMLFASNDEKHPGGGYGYQGGTLPGQVFVHRYGRNPAFATPEFAARQDWFFAHEAAHLYQHYPELGDDGDSWIHEGGADALAAVALQELEVIDREAVQRQLAEKLSTCAGGIAKRPLRQAHLDGSFDASYACGFVLQMAVDAAALRASDGACGLACVWRDFQAATAAGQPWNSDTFISVAAKRTGESTGALLRSVVNQVNTNPEAVLREGMAASGWTLPTAAAP